MTVKKNKLYFDGFHYIYVTLFFKNPYVPLALGKNAINNVEYNLIDLWNKKSMP